MKVYKVEFMEYTNATRDAVSNGDPYGPKRKYINVGKEAFLVKESDLEKYMAFGGGFRTIQFVGNINEEEL